MDRRAFLRTSGQGLAGVCIAAPLLSACGSPTDRPDRVSEETLRQRSVAAFRRFSEVWNFNDFWKRGNTFDACLRFTAALVDRWPDDPEVMQIQQDVRGMLEENLGFFRSFDPGGLWADDFGWWGLMALNARAHLLRMGDRDLADEFLRLSTDLCWEYKRNTAYDHGPDARPVPHGCRNGDANGQSRGVKNTVTNVLLFLLSSRIFRQHLDEELPDREKYLDMAYRQWVWFSSWFALEQYEYLKHFGNAAALVQERPMAAFEGSDYLDTTHPPWEEGWVWTGDQGMLVGALADMLAVSGHLEAYLERIEPETAFDAASFEREVTGVIRLLGQGVRTALIADVDGIIREAPCASSFGPAHGNDYLAGRGIMMRYLGATREKSLIGVDLTPNVRATVEAIWETRDPSTNQFAPEYTTEANDRTYIAQFHGLWGLADDIVRWDLERMHPQNRDGVCMAVGMDMLGAAIRSL